MLSEAEVTSIHMQRGVEDIGLLSEIQQMMEALNIDDETMLVWYPRLYELKAILELEKESYQMEETEAF